MTIGLIGLPAPAAAGPGLANYTRVCVDGTCQKVASDYILIGDIDAAR